MSFRTESVFYIPRRRYVYIAGFLLIGISFVGIISSTIWSLLPNIDQLGGKKEDRGLVKQSPFQEQDRFEFQEIVKGPPANNFRGLLVYKCLPGLQSLIF